MAKIDKSLRDEIIRMPKKGFNAIVRTDGYLSLVADACLERGITIVHKYRLIHALAVYAQGELLLALADHPHVIYIESDEDVCL